MSAAMDSFTEIVHVRLLGEGTDVWRPVRARRISSGVFELAPDPVPADENWEFPPGDRVTVGKRNAATIAVAHAAQRVKP
jgi:hypothetical protein